MVFAMPLSDDMLGAAQAERRSRRNGRISRIGERGPAWGEDIFLAMISVCWALEEGRCLCPSPPWRTRGQQEVFMVTALVLMNVEPSRVNEVAEQLLAVRGVSEVYSVAGRVDLVAVIRAKDNETVSQVVTEHFLKVQGIKSSETLIAFRAFSTYDLERMFSIGMDADG
jgi:DNA-binding Lrp family transcriptional regulator